MILTIVILQSCWNLGGSICIAHVRCLKNLDTLLLNVGERRRKLTKSQRVVYASFRQFEGVCGTVVAIDALHLVYRKILHGFLRRVLSQVFALMASYRVRILKPRDTLALRVRGCVADLRSIAKVRAVNAPHLVSANEHSQDGLRFGISFIVRVLEFDDQPGPAKLVRPMAVFARLT